MNDENEADDFAVELPDAPFAWNVNEPDTVEVQTDDCMQVWPAGAFESALQDQRDASRPDDEP